MKRSDYLSWNDYFMAVAQLSAQRSKDPNTQVGACIVNTKNRIVGVGYNGFPNGCSDDEFSWDRDGDFLNTKYAFVCHSEQNAIISSTCDLEGATLFVTLFPCNECAKLIIQSGIKQIYYLIDKYKEQDSYKVSRRLFDTAGVRYEQYIPEKDIIEVWMK